MSTKQMSQKQLSYPIIVHSHLHWDWVWQRPQQFLSRLSRRHRVLFVEVEWVETNETPRSIIHQVPDCPNVTRLKMQFPASCSQDGARVDNERYSLLRRALNDPQLARKFDNPVQWFYDPMSVTAFAGKLNEIATVYDCMDELSQFKFAPRELVQRERQLLSLADVVFAGGRKMHESKSRYNDNCHFYGCGVDVEHFGQARATQTAVPDDLKAIARNSGAVLGYFGVVDERMDYDLVTKLADANPHWSIVMVGPTAKIDPAALPSRDNIHWLGGRNYLQLPAYTKGFDACLMPFALNEATEYINPTKALEYMAAGKPIVSSAVPDVVTNFSQVVKVAASHDEFIALCRSAVAQPDQVAIERGLRMAQANTWDAIVTRLEGHINDVLNRESVANTADLRSVASVAPVASVA